MSRLVVPITETDHVWGPTATPVTMVEYGDYECPYCGKAQRHVKKLQEDMRARLRFAFRHFPLTQVHPHALLAAQAVEAAGAQGRYWDMHDLLFENQDALEQEHLIAYADELSLDVERFAQDIATDAQLPKIRADVRSGIRSGVNGTPTFFINGYRHNGPWDYENLAAAVADAEIQVATAEDR